MIAGGESGAERRPPDAEWLRGLRDRCVATGVAFSFKGWGGRGQNDGGRRLDGREWSESPPMIVPAGGDQERGDVRQGSLF